VNAVRARSARETVRVCGRVRAVVWCACAVVRYDKGRLIVLTQYLGVPEGVTEASAVLPEFGALLFEPRDERLHSGTACVLIEITKRLVQLRTYMTPRHARVKKSCVDSLRMCGGARARVRVVRACFSWTDEG
jgi:hypothetical protein